MLGDVEVLLNIADGAKAGPGPFLTSQIVPRTATKRRAPILIVVKTTEDFVPIEEETRLRMVTRIIAMMAVILSFFSDED